MLSWWRGEQLDGGVEMVVLKCLRWMRSSLLDLKRFPIPVKQELGFALYQAQLGEKHPHAKPLKGFGGAGVLEVVADHDGETYRAVYTVRFPRAVYVLHAFQKKSKRGIATPQQELAIVRERFRDAEAAYYQEFGKS